MIQQSTCASDVDLTVPTNQKKKEKKEEKRKETKHRELIMKVNVILTSNYKKTKVAGCGAAEQ